MEGLLLLLFRDCRVYHWPLGGSIPVKALTGSVKLGVGQIEEEVYKLSMVDITDVPVTTVG